MKKLLTLLFTCLIFSYAQAQYPVKLGFRAGANISNQTIASPTTKVNPDSRIGFHLGGIVHKRFAQKYGLQAEGLISLRGSEYEIDGNAQGVRLTYVNIPLLFSYNPVPFINVNVGPYVGYLISAKYEDDRYRDNQDFSSSDFGGIVGINWEHRNGFMAGVRYAYGLKDINDVPESSETMNQAIMLTVGFIGRIVDTD